MKVAASLTVCLAAMMPLASAWPKWLPEVDALVVRQESESEQPSASATDSSARPSATGDEDEDEDSSSASSASGSSSQTDLNTAKAASGTKSDKSSTRTQTEFDADDPVGGITMLTPAPNDPAPRLYKIGDHVTFGWNYTNLQADPTAVDVLISMTSPTMSWTLTQNMSWTSEGSFTWDSSEEETAVQSPLPMGKYTLVIHDSKQDVDASPTPGYLGVFNQFTFDMYTRKKPTPLAEYKCPTCSGAAPSIDSKAVGFAITMSMVTVASFTWFVTGLVL